MTGYKRVKVVGFRNTGAKSITVHKKSTVLMDGYSAPTCVFSIYPQRERLVTTTNFKYEISSQTNPTTFPQKSPSRENR